MNNTFNIKRFGKVFGNDASDFFPKFGGFLIVLWAIPIIIWIFTLLNIDDSPINPTFRYVFILLLCSLSCLLVPARLYRHINDPKKGMEFAMTPASSFEKFLSMTLFCAVITPAIYFIGAYAIDFILSIIPNSPYNEYIWDKGMIVSNYDDNQLYLSVEAKGIKFGFFFKFFYRLTSCLMTASIFMLGNAIFKKRKTSKTIGILVLFAFIATTIIITTAMSEHFDEFMSPIVERLDDMPEEERTLWFASKVKILLNWAIISKLLVSAVCLFFTYRKVKTQRY